MTYNINAEKNGPNSYGEVANVIKTINPDICGLQKVDSCATVDTLDVSKWLGAQTSKVNSFAVAVKNYKSSKGSYGVAFLSNEAPQSVRRLWIEHTQSETDRGVLEIGITMGGEKVRVLVTHVAHEGETYRTAQIKKIIAWIDSVSKVDPVIIMADFNAAPTESSMKQFETAGFAYVKGANGAIFDTSTSQKINHILYRPQQRWSVVEAGNPAYPDVSNRNPVWANMKLVPSIGITVNKIETKKDVLFSYKNHSIKYLVNTDAPISIMLYNSSGRKMATLVSNQIRRCGEYSIDLNRMELPSGVYHCKYLAGKINTIYTFVSY
jgi:endonuclease/exonuclease/phosphatase family metal-dependent hydrolase